MSANVETAVYNREPAWHREGVVLDPGGDLGLSVPVALDKSGLDWRVRKVPIFAASNYTEDDNGHIHTTPKAKLGNVISDRFGVQRESDDKILGVVGSTWQPVQNHEGFELIEDFMQGDTAYIEAAGALDGGRKVWILAHMAEDMQIAGEDIYRYVLFTNGHDGRTSVTAATCNTRVVCQNTLTMALRETQRIVRVRHTTKATKRLAEAKKVLNIVDKNAIELAKQGEWLVEQEMSDKQFDKFLERLMPVPEEQEGKPAETMICQRQSDVRAIYRGTDDLNDIRGTRWGAFNAVVDYADHHRKFRDDNTRVKAQFGITATPIKDKAFALLTD